MSASDAFKLFPSLATFAPVAPGVGRLAILFVNVYAVDLPDGGGWVLVDTGPPGAAGYVRAAVADRYGNGARPNAIVLTHAHFDHAGNAKALAEAWDVPVYVGEKELPYVTGASDYAPADPTPGGAICFLSRFFPRRGIDLGDRVDALPHDGSVPAMPGWRAIPTPGHTAGHVSLIRDVDRVAIVGDVLATHDMDAWSTQMTWPRQIARPATPFTPDWESARSSIRALAAAKPTLVAAGHGLPIDRDDLPAVLRGFADAMPEPEGGRYQDDPAEYRPDGALARVPPPAPDPIKRELVIVGGVAGLLVGIAAAAWAASSHARRRPTGPGHWRR